jgi:preprotein translocase subunit SecD
MLDFPRWKIWSVSIIVVLGVLFAVPSLLPERVTAPLPSFLNKRINLGLDLAGGSHLLLEGQTADVARQQLETMEENIRREMRRASPRIEIGEVSTTGGRLSFVLRNPAQLGVARNIVNIQTQPVTLGSSDWNIQVEDGNRFVLTPTQAGISAAIDRAMEVATEVVRRRIDELGTREPTIIRQGSTRIVVQVPGLQDPEALKALLGRTARLDFKLVDLTASPEQIAQGRAPVGSQVLPFPGTTTGRVAVQRRAMVTGDQITDARQSFDQQTGEPVVTIQFDSSGARRFANVTRENVNKPFAIILDNVVISAPNINEPILGGSAQIAGTFTVDTANELAISLRSGRLPIELTVVEERTIGPELGRDSIRKGVIAGAVGTVLVLIFIFLTYGRFGVYANIALILNALLILAVMATIIPAALTLPGIAGFVLTIGAAVDANVIINERIREEQRRGRNIVQAIEHGYKEAQTAIFDANITNVIAGSLLFYFGSGPVRGFAVVMIIGIITSVFTAVTVTRMFVSIWLRRRRPTQLVI